MAVFESLPLETKLQLFMLEGIVCACACVCMCVHVHAPVFVGSGKIILGTSLCFDQGEKWGQLSLNNKKKFKKQTSAASCYYLKKNDNRRLVLHGLFIVNDNQHLNY